MSRTYTETCAVCELSQDPECFFCHGTKHVTTTEIDDSDFPEVDPMGEFPVSLEGVE